MKKLINLIVLVMLVSTNVFTPFTYAQVPETGEILVRDGDEVVAENVEEVEQVEQKTESKFEYSDTVEDNSEENSEENLYENTIGDSTLDLNLDDIEKKESLNSEENETVETELNQQLGEVIGINTMFSDIKTSVLIPGIDFNKKVKTLANGREESYGNIDYNVLQIVESEYEAPEGSDAMNLASSGSDYPVYFWYDSGIIYYHTKADAIYFNEDCRYMFSRFSNLKMIDIAKFDNSNMTNIDYMFAYSENLNYIMSSDFSFKNSNNIFSGDYNLIGQGGTKYKGGKGVYALVDNAMHSGYFWGDYVVMFDSNGGEEVGPQTFSVGDEYNIREPNIERENSIFKGWYTVGGQKWNFEDTVTKPIILYAKWECEDGYLASIDGNSCVSTDTITIDSVDGGKITIMKEDIGVGENGGWNERDQGPCPAGYHVPTMQEWNTLFVSWCENHTILGDGICDIRDIERQTWEYGKDFIYFTKNEESIRNFGEEMNLEFKLNISEIYSSCERTRDNRDCNWGLGCFDAEEWEEYGCEDLLNEGFAKGALGGYRTSTPEGNILGFRKSYFWVNSFYPSETSDPLFRSIVDSEELPVRCFADNYTAPDKLVMLDIIDKENLAEYKEFEQKIRSGELALPEEKQREITLLKGMDESPKNSISNILEEIDYTIENLDNDEEIRHLQELKSLLEDVKNATDENKAEILDRFNSFDWSELFGESFEKLLNSLDLGILAIDNVLGAKDSIEISGFDETVTLMIGEFEGAIDELFNMYDFFTDFDKELIYSDIENLRYCDSKDDIIIFFNNLVWDIEDLLDNYVDEIGPSAYMFKMEFSILQKTIETTLSLFELDEFAEEAKDYLGTDNWIRSDGSLDYQEMVTQEYLREEFAKMGYRVMLTSKMSANDIREKIASIKGITLESDEYLALFDVNQEEINIDGGINHYERGYIEPKRVKKEEGNGRSGGGSGGGGSGKSNISKEEKSVDASEQDSQPDEQSLAGDQDDNNTLMDSQIAEQSLDKVYTASSASEGQQYSPEFQQAYEFAKGKGITTMPTIQKAQMDGKLTRIAMAKMLSQYAINVLGQTPDTSKKIKFKDVTKKKDAEYDNGVTLAYQLGIMGQNMPNNKFRPDDEVPRAEFVAALSRMLYNTSDGEYKSTSKYYIHHMEKLKAEGIVTNDDPKMKERRGYVMIMLMRSAK